MQRDSSYPEINMSRIRVGGGLAGLLFAAGTVYIFVVGVPVIRSFFMWSLIAGALVSIGLRLAHKHKPSPSTGGHIDLAMEAAPAGPRGSRSRLVRAPRPFQLGGAPGTISLIRPSA